MKALHLVAAIAVSGLATAHVHVVRAELDKRADFEASEIESGDKVFEGEYLFKGSNPPTFLDAIQGIEKNETFSQLQDRSVELFGRQQCQAGYGYCSGTFLLLADSTTPLS